jgi:aryl-alcohol dehydrogenase-like predicted oxidoreductase
MVVAIPGATNIQQAGENATAMDFKLSREDLDAIDVATRNFR